MDYMEEWKQYMGAVYAKSTVRSYAYGVARFRRFVGSDLLAVTSQDVQAFIAQEGQAWSSATLHWALGTLRCFFNWAVQNQLMETSPLEDVTLPRRRSLRLPKVLSAREVKLLLQCALSARDQAILLLMLDAGLRLTEVSRLVRSDVELQRRTVLVRGKGDKERIVPLSDRLHEALETWIYENTGDGPAAPLFPGYKGSLKPRGIGYIIERIGEKAGLEQHLSPHCLRHTFATRLLRRDVNLRVVQDLLGHANLTTTQIYTHVVAADMAEAIQKLD
jgi:site-specific recombinase XerD